MPNSDRSAPQLGGAMAWWVWILAVAFFVYLFSIQTGYAIVNASVQKDAGLTATQVATIAATYTWVSSYELSGQFLRSDCSSIVSQAEFQRVTSRGPI